MGKDIEKGPCVYTTDESPGYDQELYEFMFDTARKNMAFGEYGMLHRLNLIDIQNDLAECRSTIWKHKGASKTVREMLRLTLRDYGIEPNIIDIHGSKANMNNSSSHPRLRLYDKDDALQVPRCKRLEGWTHRQIQKNSKRTQ
jgi:hypothetical protein